MLDLIHGQAAVVHGAHCVGHGHCQEACPTGAIQVQLAGLEERRDIPALTRSFQAVRLPGLYLAGEITGFTLIRSAVEQGRTVARAAAQAVAEVGVAPHDRNRDRDCDLVVVGSGPAGLACAVEAQERGLSVQVLEQESFGGTIASFPRRKLVLTQPVDLPGWGVLDQSSYTREELLEIWETIARDEELSIHGDARFEGLEREGDRRWRVNTSAGSWTATCVCLALGRRGSPARLGVPGEELAKVQNALLDSRAHRGRRILVVGGGDSAVESALALAMQPGNEVTLSYRGTTFTRPHPRNRSNLETAVGEGRLRIALETRVQEILESEVLLQRGGGDAATVERLPNDDVFVHIGGTTPIELLENCGVSFDPADRNLAGHGLGGHVPHIERQRLIVSVSAALGAASLTIAWAVANFDYYGLELAERPLAEHYGWLRPAGTVGLSLGIGGAAMILANLVYLLRRETWFPLRFGRLRHWMTAHIVTGILALLLALLHGGMHIGDTPGGHAALALGVLVITGAIGRYLYSFVPRAASGRDLAREEVLEDVRRLSSELEESAGPFAERIRDIAREHAGPDTESSPAWRRIWRLFGARRRLRAALVELKREAREAGRDEAQIRELSLLLVRAQRTAQSAAHFEELRSMLSTWRHIHGWMALLLVLIVAAHVWDALRYGNVFEW